MRTQVDNFQWKIPDLDVALVGILSKIRHFKVAISTNPDDTHCIYRPLGMRVKCLRRLAFQYLLQAWWVR